MSTDDDQVAIDGIAAIATTRFEMGENAEQVEQSVLAHWEALGRPDLQASADAIARQPQPLQESAEETARREPFRALLGVDSAEKQLVAALAARELLERLARERQ